MRTTGIGALGLTLALLASGCATYHPVGPSYAQAKATDTRSDAALVYVMRYKAEPSARDATILVDDDEVADLSQGGFTWFYVQPGHHVIHARWGLVLEQLPSQVTVDLEAGKTYYLELVGVSRETGHGIVRGSWLNRLSSFDAEIRLDRCGFQKPRPSWPAS